MKFKELNSMTNDEIEGKLKELRMELIKANAQIATGTVPKNPGQVKQTKKTIAKIKQILATPASEKKKAPKAENKKEEAAEEKKEEPKTEAASKQSQSDKSNKNKMEEKQE